MHGALAAVLVLLALPAVSAQLGIQNPADGAVTLHLHTRGFWDFPINAQPAEFDLEEEDQLAVGANSLSCVAAVPNNSLTGPDSARHTYYGFSTPGPVTYETPFDDVGPMVHPVQALGYNATLDLGVPPVLRWYLETTGSASTVAGSTPQVPLVVPNVVVQATIRVGDSISVDDTAYNTGPIIAQGRSAPATLAADSTTGADHTMAGDRHVYGFTIPMPLQQATLGDHGFNLRVDVFHDVQGCQDPQQGYVMANVVRPFADADHRPMITTGVLEPLRIDSLTPEFNGTNVVVRAAVRSVWGAYDVDEGNLTLTVDGPAGPFALQPIEVIQRKVEHYHLIDPVLVTWSWDVAEAGGGLYFLNLTVGNDQATAVAQATAAVHLGPDRAFAAGDELILPERESPAAPALLAGALLLALATLRRRA